MEGVPVRVDAQLVKPVLGVVALGNHIGHAPGGPACRPPDGGRGAIGGSHMAIMARGWRLEKWQQ
jgi:hypothetical protein